MLRRNGPVIKSVESFLRPEESLWWERFVKEVGLSREWKREGVMRVVSWQSEKIWYKHEQPSQRLALTLLVEWQAEHPTCKNLCQLAPKVLFHNTRRKKTKEEPADSVSPGKLSVKSEKNKSGGWAGGRCLTFTLDVWLVGHRLNFAVW